MLILDEILRNGFDTLHFITGLSSHFRDLLVCKDPQSAKLLEVGASIGEHYIQQSNACTIDFLYDALAVTTEAELQYRNAKNKRLHTEFSVIKLARLLTEKKNG